MIPLSHFAALVWFPWIHFLPAVAQERKRQRISGNVLAEKAGLSQSLISSLETNPWNPTLDTLLRIGDVLDVDVGDLITQARKRISQNK